MLKLDHPTLIGLYICDVLLSVIGFMDNLLPAFWKLPFPSAVPFGFVFPPSITSAMSFMGPVPNLDFSAFCNHHFSASRTLAGKIWLGFLALPVYQSKFHIQPCHNQLNIQLSRSSYVVHNSD